MIGHRALIGGIELANLQSAKKRIRQTETRTQRNRVYKASARTYIRRTRALIEEGNLDEAEEVAQKAFSILDKAARKRIIHPRNAARRKGRLMAVLSAARSAG
jgi:small subunit ribosomal protein S20